MDLPKIEFWQDGRAVPFTGELRELRVDSQWLIEYRGMHRQVRVTLEFRTEQRLSEHAPLGYIIITEPNNAPLVVVPGWPRYEIGDGYIYRVEGRAIDADPANPDMRYVR